jgi:hypothetical protein
MRLVVLESPFSGETGKNVLYAREALRDCLLRGESPVASHLLYTQVLDDLIPEERTLGIEAGLAWLRVAEATVVYADLGISRGMAQGIAAARNQGLEVETRYLYARRREAV